MNSYDDHATEYASLIQSRDEWGFSPYLDLVVPALLEVIGQVRGKRVLDAGCGEGYLSRLLAARGAQVIGVDISPRLVAMAQEIEGRERAGIAYRVHDLTCPFPEYAGYFDLVACNMVLNDVADFVSFIRNVGAVLRPQGTLFLSMNNPYSALARNKVENYFDAGCTGEYAGLNRGKVPAVYYHRTLEEYVGEFRRNGFCLRTLLDVQPSLEQLACGSPRPREYYRFPYFMIMEWLQVGLEGQI